MDPTNYNSCWSDFVWPSLESITDITDPIMQTDVSLLVEKVIYEINTSRTMANNLMGETPYKLTELFEAVRKVADTKIRDADSSPSSTPICIHYISKKERITAARVFTDLSKQETGLTEEELKCATLLFGIRSIRRFVQHHLRANFRTPIDAYPNALPEDQANLAEQANRAFLDAVVDGCIVA